MSLIYLQFFYFTRNTDIFMLLSVSVEGCVLSTNHSPSKVKTEPVVELTLYKVQVIS